MILNASKKLGLISRLKPGQAEFLTAGNHAWVVPAGVSSICFVMVAGGCRSGGGLSWYNDVPVTPGDVVSVTVGRNEDTLGNGNTVITINGHTYQANAPTSLAAGGVGGGINSNGAPFRNKGGGNGGNSTASAVGGGGAGGYSGNGGHGTSAQSPPASAQGSGGGGAGGYSNGSSYGAGGGVGLFGEGPSGVASTTGTINGGGGSGGERGGTTNNFNGGRFGGGRGRQGTSSNHISAAGAARIIYGFNRAFPALNTGDL